MREFEAELSKIVVEYTTALQAAKYEDGSDVLRLSAVMELQTRCMAAVERAAGRESIYFKNVSAFDKNTILTRQLQCLAAQVGVVRSLLHDIENGYTKSLEELIHGALFGDFLEMAEYLVASHYKDAAAVIAGSTLEAHLRQLCAKAAIPTDVNGRPKKADTMNAELSAAAVYTKLDQKSITAWLGLRNDAAHGNYSSYDEARVHLLIDGIRHFLSLHPA
jgi:hypothetical protein